MLTDVIIDTIRREGALSFRDFMDMALYYPGEGYYTASQDRIGAAGDYYTSPYLTSLFGDMIAAQLEEMWILMDRPSRFTVLEYGAGAGMLCRDVLDRLKGHEALFSCLEYRMVDRNGRWENAGRMNGGGDNETGLPITGCVLSNELVDNFPVHRVLMQDELMEVFVGYDNGFTEILRPASQGLKDYLADLHVTLPKGYFTEINLDARDWIEDVCRSLERGFVITIDYGSSSPGLYTNQQGTLACYHEHQLNHSPYQWIGQQDITSRVNFSALDYWGRRCGLEYCGYTSQARFLQGLGLARRVREMEMSGSIQPGTGMKMLHTLMVEMGNTFKVLIQRKGVGRKFLSGLQFSEVLV